MTEHRSASFGDVLKVVQCNSNYHTILAAGHNILAGLIPLKSVV